MSHHVPTVLAAGAIRIATRRTADGSSHVAFTWGPLTGRLSPAEAYACALSLIRAAEAAQTDQFILHFARQIQAPQQAAQLQATVQRLRSHNQDPNLNHE